MATLAASASPTATVPSESLADSLPPLKALSLSESSSTATEEENNIKNNNRHVEDQEFKKLVGVEKAAHDRDDALTKSDDKSDENSLVEKNDYSNNNNKNNEEEEEDDSDNDSCISNLSLYRLDFEDKPLARGGEVLEAGDHVYVWCQLYQHHGIVLEAQPGKLLIAEFTNADLPHTPLVLSASHSSRAVSTGVQGAFRFVQETDPGQWHKVRYQASPVQCLTWRPGTCSGETPDNVELVLTRVQFLHTCRHLIPDYHVLASNCEAVAVWCMTGKYTSIQAQRMLDYSKATIAGVGAAMFPIAGVMLGGLSAWHSVETHKKCQETTAILNREFAVYNMGKSPLDPSNPKWIPESGG